MGLNGGVEGLQRLQARAARCVGRFPRSGALPTGWLILDRKGSAFRRGLKAPLVSRAVREVPCCLLPRAASWGPYMRQLCRH